VPDGSREFTRVKSGIVLPDERVHKQVREQLRDVENQGITIDDLVAAFKARWYLVVLPTLLLCAAVVAYIVLRPTRYRGTSTILVVTPDMSARASQLAVLNASASTPLRMIKGIMTSERERGAIIKKYDLDWKKFANDFAVVDESQTNQLVITYEGVDKQQILDIINFSLGKLGELDKELSFTVGTRQAETLKDAVANKEKEVDAAEKALLAFQQSMKTASDPTDTKSVAQYVEQLRRLEFELGGTREQLRILRQQFKNAGTAGLLPTIIPGAANWQKKLAEAALELKVAKTTYGDENPEVVRLKRAYQQIEQQYKDEVAKYLRSVDKNLDPDVAQLEGKRLLLEYQTEEARKMAKLAPGEAMQLSKFVNEVMTLRTVLNQLRGQFEQARVESEVSKVRWQVLDPPYIERLPTNKSFKVPVIGVGFLSFFLTMLLALRSYRKKGK
jgi:uncharacterized protein involved in exopolysaccharide biosynthesis